MKSIVISLGGSVFLSSENDIDYFEKLQLILSKVDKFKIFIVVGGGKTARSYIQMGRKLDLDEKTLDEIGIQITRVNAKILTDILKNTNKEIPCTTNAAKKMEQPVVIMGGTTPGHSTDMVAAELAKKTNSLKLIIATNVDGVYTKDPNLHDDAMLIEEISVDELIKKYGTNWELAGKNTVIDGPALKTIKDAKIPTFVINGTKLDQLKNVIFNKKFKGTKIKN